MWKKLIKGSNSETEKERAIFVLYVTHCLDLIHIAIKFHQDTGYGMHKDSVKK